MTELITIGILSIIATRIIRRYAQHDQLNEWITRNV